MSFKVKSIASFVLFLGFISQSVAGILTEASTGMSNYSLLVTGDANLGNGVHIHGGAYIGGDLTLTGGNTSVGSDLVNADLGLYIGGSALSNQRIDLMSNNYYIGGSNNAILQNAGTELSIAPALPLSPAAMAAVLLAKSNELYGMGDYGVAVDASDFNRVQIDLTAGAMNVVHWDSSNAAFLSAYANLQFNNFTDDTFLIINYDLTTALDFRAKNEFIPSLAYGNVIWNFVGGENLNITNSVSTFKGSILATDSSVDWNANDIDGQLVAKSLTWNNTSQSHHYIPWTPAEKKDIPEPASIAIFSLGLLGLLANRKRLS
ncbi:choice-of-anchor A family protein [Alteromonadaceae bacterium BrNp21-10]|nr:choice-of-anchor A family protein [Alteromonadaceae bacterium BrNp21-10]